MTFVKAPKSEAVEPFELHDKQKEALNLLKEHPSWTDYLLIGGSRCVAGDTVLGGAEETFAALCERGETVSCTTSEGWRTAEAPYEVGFGSLIQLVTESGKTIRVTQAHRFWTGSSWVCCEDLHVGSLVAVRKDRQTVFDSLHMLSSRILTTIPHTIEKIQEYLDTKHSREISATGEAPRAAQEAMQLPEELAADAAFCDTLLNADRAEQQRLLGTLGFGGPSTPVQRIEQALGALQDRFSVSYDTPARGSYQMERIVSYAQTDPQKYYTTTVPIGHHYFANDFLNKNSGKTFFGIHLCVVRALKYPNSRHIVCRLRFSHAKTSIWMDTLPKVLKAMGLVNKRDYKLNKTDYVVMFKNGAELWIDGLDNAERVEKMLGREYNTIYYNEISQIPYDTVTTVQSRLALRSWSPKYGLCRNISLYDANPPTKRHWSYLLWFKGVDPADVMKKPLPEKRKTQLGYIKMNPQDNVKNVGAGYIELLENLPERKKKRFLEGEYADVEGQIYNNWQTVATIPKEIRETAQCTLGIDFGFTVDPAAVVRIYYVRKRFGRGQLWIEQILYEREHTNKKLAAAILTEIDHLDKQLAYREYHEAGGILAYEDYIEAEYERADELPIMCYADGHEPKSIVEVQGYANEIEDGRLIVMSGLLGEDARRAGIDWLQDVDMFVHQNASDVIAELETYEYAKDAEGNSTKDPIKTGDHAMDALRYGVRPYIVKKAASLVAVGAD